MSFISTHALTEGDKFFPGFKGFTEYFNSRPHGGRPVGDVAEYLEQHISTHALTEGDGKRCDCTRRERTFQLTPSRRATAGTKRRVQHNRNFNSRPHGGRPSAAPAEWVRNDFNSRPHGGRHPGGRFRGSCKTFQLTPSRRATWKLF